MGQRGGKIRSQIGGEEGGGGGGVKKKVNQGDGTEGKKNRNYLCDICFHGIIQN